MLWSTIPVLEINARPLAHASIRSVGRVQINDRFEYLQSTQLYKVILLVASWAGGDHLIAFFFITFQKYFRCVFTVLEFDSKNSQNSCSVTRHTYTLRACFLTTRSQSFCHAINTTVVTPQNRFVAWCGRALPVVGRSYVFRIHLLSNSGSSYRYLSFPDRLLYFAEKVLTWPRLYCG